MKRITFLLVLVMVLMADVAFGQCAMCRASVDSNLSEGRGVIGTGINVGIVYLLVMPYLLVGLLIFFYFKEGKKNLAKRLALQKRLKQIYG